VQKQNEAFKRLLHTQCDQFKLISSKNHKSPQLKTPSGKIPPPTYTEEIETSLICHKIKYI